jgi:hypothetical protein
VRASADRRFWRFEPDSVAVDTARAGAGDATKAKSQVSREARQFADQATRRFPELARTVPVFAGLGNLITLSLVAEIVHQAAADSTGPASWRPTFFLDAAACRTATVREPRQTPAMVNVRQGRGGAWVFAVSGGVDYRPDMLVRTPLPLVDESQPTDRPVAPVDGSRWWWD